MKLEKKIFIEGKIVALTGLHIGGSSLGMSIGSTENTVVRNPFTNEPYIPGSSIRGKMRSLLERFEGKFTPMEGSQIKHGPFTTDPNDLICKVFGVPAKEATTEETLTEKQLEEPAPQPPSRLIIRDGNLLNASDLESAHETDMPFTEVKTEVVIDRITSAAMPRQLERVPAGAEFGLDMVLNIWEGDDEKAMLDLLFRGLVLMQNDYLGGHGARGSGQVEVIIKTPLKEKAITEYVNAMAPRPRSGDSIHPELKTETEEATGASH